MLKPKDKLEITKQKLIAATTELLSERNQDYKALTSREIAKRAGVPLGMINYSFGSKDNLVLKVFLDTYESKLDEHRKMYLDNEEITDPRAKLKNDSFKIVKIFIGHFDCIKDVLKYIATSYDVTKVIRSHELIKACVGEGKSEEEYKLMAFELGAILQLAVLRHQELKEHFGLDLTDDKQLMLFIEEQVDKIVH